MCLACQLDHVNHAMMLIFYMEGIVFSWNVHTLQIFIVQHEIVEIFTNNHKKHELQHWEDKLHKIKVIGQYIYTEL